MTTKFNIGAVLVLAHAASINTHDKGFGGTYDRLCKMKEPFTVKRTEGLHGNIIVTDANGCELEADAKRFVLFELQVGKTYKTRRGLKVGPMRANTGIYNHAYPFVAVDPDGDETAWLSNGGYLRSEPGHKFDLVAEWVEPAVPATPAAPAFKVGDKVRMTSACESGWWFGEGDTGTLVRKNAGSRYQWGVKVDGKGFGIGGVDVKHIELITPTVPAGPFKVGDRVVCTDFGGDRYGLKGIIGTVTNPKNYESVLVTWDAPFSGHGASRRDWNVKPAHLRLATEADKPGSFIVVNVAPNGKLAAAANPFIHTTREAAEKEALRLSEVVRGQDFRVYSFNHLSTAKAEKPLPAPAGKLVAVGASL